MRRPPPDLLIGDFETSGLEVSEGAEAVQGAAVLLRGSTLEEVGAVAALMRPEHPERANLESLAISGHTLDKLSRAPLPSYFLISLARLAEQAEGGPPIWIGHNAAFDLRFLAALEKRHGLTVYRRDEVGCTCVAMRVHLQARDLIPSGKLTACAAYYGIAFDAHDALGDVRATAELLRRLRAEDPILYRRAIAGEVIDTLLEECGSSNFVKGMREKWAITRDLSAKQLMAIAREARERRELAARRLVTT